MVPTEIVLNTKDPARGTAVAVLRAPLGWTLRMNPIQSMSVMWGG